MRYVWDTPGMVYDLALILEKGATASEAATFLRNKYRAYISRNAVIGKALRLGIELRSQGSHAASVSPKARVRAKRPRIVPEPVPVRMPVMTDEPQPRGDVDDGCQWLHGDATLRNFCGHVTWPLTPWCDYHARRVWNSAATVKSNLRATSLAEVA